MPLILRDLTTLSLSNWDTFPEESGGAPVFTSTGGTQVTMGNVYAYTPIAEDSNGNVLSVTAMVIPAWASYSNGTITGTPDYGHLGSTTVRLQITEGDLTVEQVFFLTVVPAIAAGRHFPTHLVSVRKSDRDPKAMPPIPYGGQMDYGFDWTNWLEVDDTVIYSTWESTPGLPMLRPYLSNPVTSTVISGAMLGTRYLLTNKVVTAQGRVVSRSVRFRCKIK